MSLFARRNRPGAAALHHIFTAWLRLSHTVEKKVRIRQIERRKSLLAWISADATVASATFSRRACRNVIRSRAFGGRNTVEARSRYNKCGQIICFENYPIAPVQQLWASLERKDTPHLTLQRCSAQGRPVCFKWLRTILSVPARLLIGNSSV